MYNTIFTTCEKELVGEEETYSIEYRLQTLFILLDSSSRGDTKYILHLRNDAHVNGICQPIASNITTNIYGTWLESMY